MLFQATIAAEDYEIKPSGLSGRTGQIGLSMIGPVLVVGLIVAVVLRMAGVV